MAIVIRPRAIADIRWHAEDESERRRRRSALCELDGLLTELEESNLCGRAVAPRVRKALGRHGVLGWRDAGPPELIESIFEVQERYMLYPESEVSVPTVAQPARDLAELRRRMAS